MRVRTFEEESGCGGVSCALDQENFSSCIRRTRITRICSENSSVRILKLPSRSGLLSFQVQQLDSLALKNTK